MLRVRHLMLVFILFTASIVSATETEHLGMQVLPAPGKVTVDGKFDDWDLTGGILVCGDVETARDKVSVWYHAMYDADNLYLLARWNDDKPLNNPGVTAGDFGFQGDCLQVRIIAAPATSDEMTAHLTAWRGRDGKDIIDCEYGKQFNEGKVKDLKTQGAQQGFAEYANGKGYGQEIAVPWSKLVKNGHVPKAGESLRMAIEPNFTIGTNGRISYKDNFQAGMTLDRVFTFMANNQWGNATLEKQGKLAPRPVRLSDGREFQVKMDGGVPVVDWTGLIKSRELNGFKTVKFTMPEDGYVSLNIRNAEGEVVRQLLSCEFVTKGEHEFKWDGLSTFNFRKPGDPVKPGSYTWQAIYHTGIGLRLKGWACNAGITPWDFPAGKGNWGGDHGVPTTVATDKDHVYLGWNGAEAGKALLGCDLEGNVLWNNTHGGIGGAGAIAVDDTTVYALNYQAIYRVSKKDGVYNAWEGTGSTDLPLTEIFADFKESPEHRMMFAVGGGKLYVSSQKHDQVAVLNAATGKVEQRIAVKSPRNLAFSPRGKLYVVSNGETVLAYAPGSDQSQQVLSSLSNATSVAVDKDDQLYVGVRDPENQIKVFAADGKPMRAIGRAGGRSLIGPWTPDGIRFVNAVAVDAAGKLWVVESDLSPKRISVWNASTGEFVKEFFGPSSYGALGGAILPSDPNVMVGQNCEWRLDPKTGRAKCTAVITRDGMENARFAVGSNGKTYLAVCGEWAFSLGTVRIFERLGDADYKLRSSFRYEGKDKDVKTIFWADKNGDSEVQADETVTVPGNLRFSSWYMHLAGNLSISAGDQLLRATGFTPCGAPVWDVANPQKMPAIGQASADDKLVMQWGEYNVDHSWMRCFDIASGKERWSYPHTFVGVHGSHNAPAPEVGLVRGSFPPCGVAKLPAPIGNIWVIPTNVGEWHIINDQGFYLTRLFVPGDSLSIQWPEAAVPGAILDNVPPGMGGEDFGGSVTLAADGKLYVQAGKTAFWNVEVVGLESVKQLPGGTVSIEPGEEKLAADLREKYLQERSARQQLIVPKLSPKFTGNLDEDFKGATFVKFQKSDDQPIRAAATWDDNNLYLAWEVRDKTPWVNGATEREMLYLHGDTVDFQLGVDPAADPNRNEAVLGDLRLSIGNFQGKPQAILYRKVARDQHPRSFSSGVIKDYKMDSVTALEDVTIDARSSGGDRYMVEAAIPLRLLDLKPSDGLQLRGDFGATHGDQAGQRTRLRSYWTNQHTGIVDDAVFELQMEPKNWGAIQFKQ